MTIIELLIVIAVIALLISMITVVGGSAISSHRRSSTASTMRAITLALDEFRIENPLRLIYDQRNNASFGPLPPYQIRHQGTTSDHLPVIVEGNALGVSYPSSLQLRLARDMGLNAAQAATNIKLAPADRNDDNRALYTYLKLFAPESLKQVPESSLKPLRSGSPELINANASNVAAAGVAGTFDVLGFHDAWGVPMEYMMYVRVEWQGKWVIVDRVPVLRSLGITREEYDVAFAVPTPKTDPKKWIFSADFPSPTARFVAGQVGLWGGQLVQPAAANPASSNGWARLRSEGDRYGYYPDLSLDEN
ncbi:MAG: hypothetical protein U1D55_14070 [Phycisphaerae bacterium]